MPSHIEEVLFVWVCVCGLLDLLYRRLPNLLTLGAYLPAIAVMVLTHNSWLGGTVSSSLLAWLVALSLTLPAYAAGWIAAGDVKYFSAIGLLCGIDITLLCYVVAAVISLVILVTRPLYSALLHLIASKQHDHSSVTINSKSIPFGSCLSLGVIVGLIAPL